MYQCFPKSTSKDIEEILKWLTFENDVLFARNILENSFRFWSSRETGNFLKGCIFFFLLQLLFPTENDITEIDPCATQHI